MGSGRKDKFNEYGPMHLSCVDWNNADHRTSVLASLVNGVYVLQNDRQMRRQGPDARAAPWWEFFNFELVEWPVDTEDDSVICALYRNKLFDIENNSTGRAPQLVIAFRGTILKGTVDCRVNWELIKNGFKKTARFEIAMNFVEHLVSTTNGGMNLWLTGHSLGSSMALKAGRNMAKKGIFLETHLFNPPFPSLSTLSIHSIRDEKAKHAIKSVISVGKAIVATAQQNGQHGNSSEEAFRALQGWTPNLYVHRKDVICAAYIDYFEHRKYMEEKGAVKGYIENIAAQYSTIGLMKNAIGKDHESLHLIPSATLTKNEYQVARFLKAHKLCLWWSRDIDLRSTTYKYEA